MDSPSEKIKLEEFSREFLDNILKVRFDICTCKHCRKEMIDDAVSQLPLKKIYQKISETGTVLGDDDLVDKFNRALRNSIEIIGKNPPHKISEDKSHTFKLIIKKILNERNFDLRHYHFDLLKRRLAIRIRSNNLHSYPEYIHFLSKNPSEYDRLFETLCINVSEFFRDPPVWVTIRYLFENLLRIKSKGFDRHIRVWSAGCANGEEPYSLALIIKETLKTTGMNFRFEVFATDIDKASLIKAQKGVYPKESLKNLDEKSLSYFEAAGDGIYEIKGSLKSLVTFANLDLTSGEFLKHMDVLACRNVFIYFNKKLQEEMLKKFHDSLKPGGYLILGKCEALVGDTDVLFDAVDTNAHIYRKRVKAHS